MLWPSTRVLISLQDRRRRSSRKSTIDVKSSGLGGLTHAICSSDFPRRFSMRQVIAGTALFNSLLTGAFSGALNSSR